MAAAGVTTSFGPSFFDRLVPRPIRALKRFMVVSLIISKNLLAWVLDYWELTRFIPGRVRRDLETTGQRQPAAMRFRKTMEELGPTFVKTAQLLSTRPDLLPREALEELKKLQDTVAPFPFEEVRAIIQAELGKPLEEIYDSFEETPHASASIGQVHLARLLSGEEVVVKVQRPAIRPMIDQDIEIMHRFTARLERHFEWAKRYALVDRVAEFSDVIHQELDYTYEAQNAERFYRNFDNEPRIKIPRIYWDYTTRRVLTMERIRGVKLSDNDRLKSEGHNLGDLARIIGDSYVKQILIDGFFHADPHPGNIFVTGPGRIALIDFGMVGVVDKTMRKSMARYFIAIVNKDAQTFVEVLDEITHIHPDTDREKLARDVGKIITRYSGQKLGQIRLETLIPELMDLTFRYKIYLPGEFAVMDKALITLEGLGRLLDPDFDLMAAAQPASKMLLRRELGSDDLPSLAARLALESRDLLVEMPRLSHRILKELGKGNLTLGVRDEEAERRQRQLLSAQAGMLNRFGLLLGAAGLGILMLMFYDTASFQNAMPYAQATLGGLLALFGLSMFKFKRKARSGA